MKTHQISIKTIAFFLILLTLLQGCIAYEKTPVSLLQAEQSKKRVKLKTNSNRSYYFNQIVSENEQFYGLKKEKGEIVKISISDYNEAFLQNKSKSTWTTIGVIAVPTIIAVIIGINEINNYSFTTDLGF